MLIRHYKPFKNRPLSDSTSGSVHPDGHTDHPTQPERLAIVLLDYKVAFQVVFLDLYFCVPMIIQPILTINTADYIVLSIGSDSVSLPHSRSTVNCHA